MFAGEGQEPVLMCVRRILQFPSVKYYSSSKKYGKLTRSGMEPIKIRQEVYHDGFYA